MKWNKIQLWKNMIESDKSQARLFYNRDLAKNMVR